jgi:hypothetical protein
MALGAPNCGASFDLRLGPHVAMSPCFNFFVLIGLAVDVRKATRMPRVPQLKRAKYYEM